MPHVIMRAALAGAALVISAAAIAQWPGDPPPPSPLPTLVQHSPTVQGFVPKGWQIEQRVSGDLNGDGRADDVLVMKDRDKRNFVHSEGMERVYDSNPRLLVVLIADARSGYRLGEQNGTLIPRLQNVNEDDVFDGIGLNGPTVTIEMHEHFEAGGWKLGNTRYRLRWQGARLVVIGMDFDGLTRDGATRKFSANFLTRKAVETRGEMDGSAAVRTRTVRLSRGPVPVNAIGDGLMFDPFER